MIRFRLANENDSRDYAHILNQSWKDTYGAYILEEHDGASSFVMEKIL